jgi:hypothetical protein
MHTAMNNGQTVVDQKEQQSTSSNIELSPAKENSSIPMSSQASTQAIASIGSYCLANMVMTVTNKYVFSVCPSTLYLRSNSNLLFRAQNLIFIVASPGSLIDVCSNASGMSVISLSVQFTSSQERTLDIFPRFQR